MQKHTTEELQDMFKGLPSDIKDAIFSLDVSEKINNAGKRNSLTVEQLGELGSEVGLVLLGATKVADFVDNLIEKLNISKDIAVRVAETINMEIFSPIRNSLEQVHNVKDIRFSEDEPLATVKPLQPLSQVLPVVKKEDILQVIEEGEKKNEDALPIIFTGIKTPEPQAPTPVPTQTQERKPFDLKTEQEIFRNPPEKTNYTTTNPTKEAYPEKGDPYRELPE